MSVPARDLSPFFAPRSIAVVGAGERATSSGGAIMQMLRQAGYGGRVVPVNPKGGTIFGYESVTSIAAIDPPVDLAVIVIRPDAILEAVRRSRRPRHPQPPDPARRLCRGRAGRRGTQRGAAETRGRSRPHHRRAQLRRHHPSRSGLALRRDLPARPAARRRGRRHERARLHLAVRRARRGVHRQGQCPRPAAHVGGVGRQRRPSRRRGLSRLAGRPARDRRRAALCRIDRGSRALPRGRPRRRGTQAGDRPVRRSHRDRWPGGHGPYRRGRQRRSRHRRLLRLLRHRPGRGACGACWWRPRRSAASRKAWASAP